MKKIISVSLFIAIIIGAYTHINAQNNNISKEYNSLKTINEDPPNIELSFNLPNESSITIEAYANGEILVDWGNGEKSAEKEGLLSGKIQGEKVILYGIFSYIDCNSSKISDLKINNQPELEELYCSSNQICELDLSGCPNIKILDCEVNQLSKIDLSQCQSITQLLCGENNITNLNLSNLENLKRLATAENKLSELDLSNNPKLNNLNCKMNNITTINLSNNKMLTWIVLSDNELTNININECTELVKLDISNNKIKSLDLSNNKSLNYLTASNNQIEKILITELPEIMEFIVDNNKISDLEYSKIKSVMRLTINSNLIKDFDLKDNLKIRDLSIYDNPISPDSFTILSNSIYNRNGEEIAGNIYLISDNNIHNLKIKESDWKTLKDKNWDLYKVEISEDGNIENILTEEDIKNYFYDESSISQTVKKDFTIYPNPTSDYIILQESVEYFKILTPNGNVTKEGYNTDIINVSDLQRGNYILLLNNHQAIKITKQ